MGRPGQMQPGDVIKFGMPRKDLHVVLGGVEIKPALALDLPTMLICAASLALLFRWKVPEPILIACAAGAGLLLRHGS